MHLGFLLPSALRRWACSSLPLCRRLAHYACNNNGNRLGQTFFLNSRQVAASGAASAQAQLGSTLPPPGIQGQGDCTSAIWTHNFAGLRVSFAAASHSSVPAPAPACLPPAPPLVPKCSNFNEEQHRFWLPAYPYRCAQSSLLSFPRVLFALVICILMEMPSD